MRIVKEAEVRKNEILDAASELFSEKGIDGTSTTDILNKIEIARGTLYHHFKSKEDIVDAVLNRYGEGMADLARQSAEDKSIPIPERIINTVLSMNVTDEQGRRMIEHAHKPQNAQMHMKMEKITISILTPIMTSLLKEGLEQGIFNTDYPEEAVEMIMYYSNRAFESENLLGLSPEVIQRKFRGTIYNMERLTGAKPGSFDLLMRVFEQGVSLNEGESNEEQE